MSAEGGGRVERPWERRVGLVAAIAKLLVVPVLLVALWIDNRGGLDDAFRRKGVAPARIEAARAAAQADFDAQVRALAAGPLHRSVASRLREAVAPTVVECEKGRHTGSTDDDYDERCDLVGVAVAVGPRDSMVADARRLAAALEPRWQPGFDTAASAIERFVCGEGCGTDDTPPLATDGLPVVYPQASYTTPDGWTLVVEWAEGHDLDALPAGQTLAPREYALVLRLKREFFRG